MAENLNAKVQSCRAYGSNNPLRFRTLGAEERTRVTSRGISHQGFQPDLYCLLKAFQSLGAIRASKSESGRQRLSLFSIQQEKISEILLKL